MAIALLGLIALQCYWIKRDLDLASKQLDQQVSLALNQTIEHYLEQQIKERPHRQIVSKWTDISENANEYFFSTDTLLHHKNIDEEVDVHVNLPAIAEKVGKNKVIERMDVRKEDDGQVRVFISTKSKDTSWVVKDEQQVVRKSSKSLVTANSFQVEKNADGEVLVEEFIYETDSNTRHEINYTTSFGKAGKYKALSKENYAILDSFLNKALAEQGVQVAYATAIRDFESNDWAFASPKYDENTTESWKIPIIGREIPSEKYQLHLQVLDKNKYLFQETLAVTTASILLIALISASFWIVVRIVLQQKKVAEVKNDFVNNMTHEFKTPISNVSLALEALLGFGKLQDPETARKYIEIAHKENNRLGKQVEKVLQMAMLEREDFELKYKPIDLHELIQEVANSFKNTISKRDGEMQLDLLAPNAKIEGDELHLSNVIANLIDNANKYSPNSPKITIQTDQTDDGFKIVVADRGIGINKDNQAKIFEKFYRVPTGNVHNVKGFGLGLSYVGQTVQKHGGKIRVESKEGEGCMFEILLPYRKNGAVGKVNG